MIPLAEAPSLPYNVEAERSVIGSLLLDRDAIIGVSQTLLPQDFYLEAHSIIYGAIVGLYERRLPADLVTLVDDLERRDLLERAGGRTYLYNLAALVPTAVHVQFYADIVSRLALRRRLIEAGQRIVTIGYDDSTEADQALDRAEAELFAIAQRRNTHGFAPISEIVTSYLERLDYIHEHRGEVVGVPTGFIDLDRITGGLQRSDLIILAARPAMGKTGMALSICHNSAVRYKSRIALFSLEMGAEQLVQRLLCMEGGLDSARLRNGHVNEEEWGRLIHAAAVLSETEIYIDDTAGVSTMDMRSKVRRLHSERQVDLVVVDYLQLMQGKAPSENRVQEISKISRELKNLARELQVPVLALSQVSRAVDARTNHIPMLSDLRESGCLSGDTPIYLPDEGVYRRIADLEGRSGFRVMAVNTATWKLEPAVVSRAFHSGFKPVYRLTTRLGRRLRATANHKFLTLAGWTALDRLVAGQCIAVPRVLPGPEEASMSDAELALLGHLVGDGCTLPRHAIQYTTNELGLAETVARLATDVFGEAITPRMRKERQWYHVYLSSTQHLTHRTRNPVTVWLDEMGVFGLRSYEKRVPDRVFAQPAAGIARFLRHLWATDGCVYLDAGTKPIPRLYYASSSVQLAYHVQSLLLRLGINASVVRRSQSGKGRDQYHVLIMGKGDIECFIAQVGGLGQNKAIHQAAILAHLAQRKANTNRDVLPRDAWRMIVRPAMRIAGLTERSMQAGLGMACCGSTIYKHSLSRERATRVAQVVASPLLGILATSDVYWDEIASIELEGETDVYDLTVDGLHNFVAADIVVHNSIEQDADVVMFLYRDKVYNPDTEKEHIADLIVAKHRNGPTGQISLFFNESQTRFVDLAPSRMGGGL
ncbi:MAG TPA: replicative DNA helicase [Chloroflexota bacterium]|nr:replicative DNA helicase [Chloroflexota bacterium]